MPTNFLDWTSEIVNRASGCPEPLIEVALRNAVRQFCRDSGIWEVSIGTEEIVPPAAGAETIDVEITDESEFTLPANTRIIRIADVKLNGTALKDRELGPGERPFRYNNFTKTLSINAGLVNESGTIEVFAVLRPTDDVATIPDALDEWKLAIIEHTLQELLMMPNREWTDRLGAADYRRTYKLKVAEATVDKSQEGTGMPSHSARIAIA